MITLDEFIRWEIIYDICFFFFHLNQFSPVRTSKRTRNEETVDSVFENQILENKEPFQDIGGEMYGEEIMMERWNLNATYLRIEGTNVTDFVRAMRQWKTEQSLKAKQFRHNLHPMTVSTHY